MEELLSQSRATGKPFCCEYRLRAYNGSIFWFRDQAAVVRDESGQPLMLQGILMDITKSKEMEQELREHRLRLEEVVMKRTSMLTKANEQLRQDVMARLQVEKDLLEERERSRVTLAAIGDVVIGIDRAACIEYMNTAAERLSGWSGAEALSQPLGLVFPLVNDSTRENVRYMFEDRQTELSGSLVCRDGREIAVGGNAAPVHDRNGKAVGAVIVFHAAG